MKEKSTFSFDLSKNKQIAPYVRGLDTVDVEIPKAALNLGTIDFLELGGKLGKQNLEAIIALDDLSLKVDLNIGLKGKEAGKKSLFDVKEVIRKVKALRGPDLLQEVQGQL